MDSTADKKMQESSKPVYMVIREDLLNDFNDRNISRLPSEREICEKYGVCRPTVQKALSYFIENDMIVRRPGKGTFFRENARKTIVRQKAKLVIRHDWQSWEGDSYFGETVQGIFDGLASSGISLTIEKFSGNLLYQLLQDKDTVSIWMSPEEQEMAAVRELAGSDCMTVLLNRQTDFPGVFWVSTDHFDEGVKAASYLNDENMAELIYFCSDAESSISKVRSEGMKSVSSRFKYSQCFFAQDKWQERFREAFRKQLNNLKPGTVAVLNNGALFPLAYEILKEKKLELNKDIFMLVFDDSREAAMMDVSVVAQPFLQIGRMGASIVSGKSSENRILLQALLKARNPQKII